MPGENESETPVPEALPPGVLWRGPCICEAELRVMVGGVIVHKEPFCEHAREHDALFLAYLKAAALPHVVIANLPPLDRG